MSVPRGRPGTPSGAPGGAPHLAVALDGAGHHPAAWREGSVEPAGLFGAGHWIELVQLAERGLLDFVTFDDTFGIQSSRRARVDDRTDQVRGRLDASLVAARVAPATRHIGLIPVVTVTYPEPFHVASAISTLDHVSRGRAGWQPRVSGRPDEADLVGTRGRLDPDDPATIVDLFEEATDAVEVVRRLWDSWEDDAIIRDVATGRFVDRDKLHYVDFEGRFFSVKGPSIVPRPPQGQPVVAALAHQERVVEFAARAADVVFVTPRDADDVERWRRDVAVAADRVGRTGEPLRTFADLIVVLDTAHERGADRKQRLDAAAGGPGRSDAAVFVGSAEQLADELLAWQAHGLDGFRLRPAVLPDDLTVIVDRLVPELQRRGAFRTAYEPGTLRQRLGLARPTSRYAPVGAASPGRVGEPAEPGEAPA